MKNDSLQIDVIRNTRCIAAGRGLGSRCEARHHRANNPVPCSDERFDLVLISFIVIREAMQTDNQSSLAGLDNRISSTVHGNIFLLAISGRIKFLSGCINYN